MKTGTFLFRAFTATAIVLTTLLITLKLFGVIDGSWWVVLSPIYIYLLVMGIAILSAIITTAALVSIINKQIEDEEEDYL